MTRKRYRVVFGIGLFLAGMLVFIGLSVLALRSGHWPGVSLVDVIAFIDPAISARMAIALSDSDILFFVLADSPLYGWLLGVGTAFFVSAMLSRQSLKWPGRSRT